MKQGSCIVILGNKEQIVFPPSRCSKVLGHVKLLWTNPTWDSPLEMVEQMSQRHLHASQPEPDSRADPSSCSERYQLEMIPVKIGATFFKPLWLEPLRLRPHPGVSAYGPHVDHQYCPHRDIISPYLRLLPTPPRAQQRPRRVQP